jgi:hypothetical protein
VPNRTIIPTIGNYWPLWKQWIAAGITARTSIRRSWFSAITRTGSMSKLEKCCPDGRLDWWISNHHTTLLWNTWKESRTQWMNGQETLIMRLPIQDRLHSN